MLLFVLLFSLYATCATAAWGYKDNGNSYTIDTGAKLVVQVSKTNGDIQSMKYNVSHLGTKKAWALGLGADS